MDNNAERLAQLQRIIICQTAEIKRLQRRRVWVPVVGTLAIFVATGGLFELVRQLNYTHKAGR
jgi:hypothetical protein